MKWSESLVKDRIDSLTFDATPEQLPRDREAIRHLKFWCEGVFDTSERVQRVKKKIEEIEKASNSREVIDVANNVLEELNEIACDCQ